MEEQGQENLREDLCYIMRGAAGVTTDPSDIHVLALHRIPVAQGKTMPVSVKFKNSGVTVKIIKKGEKRCFMFDHITQMNSTLLRELKNGERIQSV